MELKLYIGHFGNFKIEKFKKNTDKNTSNIYKKRILFAILGE